MMITFIFSMIKSYTQAALYERTEAHQGIHVASKSIIIDSPGALGNWVWAVVFFSISKMPPFFQICAV